MFTDSKALHQAIADAVGRLVSIRNFGDTVVVSLPISYPQGTLSAVHISTSGDRCFVSDCALGMREAELAGAAEFYDSAARSVSRRFGVAYDGACVFAASAPIERIEGAIIAVANASANAVGSALIKASEAKDRQKNNDVFDVVVDIFGRNNVSRKEEIPGRDDSWEAHNVVRTKGIISIFEFVSTHQNAVASKFLMFSDLSRSENSYSLNSVVESIDNLSKKATMLSDVSNIIELRSDKSTYQRYAKVA